MAWVKDPDTGKDVEIQDEYDTKTGKNIAIEKAIKEKGYQETQQKYRVVDPETKKVILVDDVKGAQAKGYIEKGEWDGRNAAVDKANNSAGGVESTARGYVQGSTFGLSDEARGLGSAVINKAKSLGSSDFGKDYEKARDDERERNKEAQSANPTEYGAGQFGGGVSTAFIPGIGAIGNVAKGATLGAKVVGGATSGAVTGALTGFGESEGSLGKQATDTVVGGLVGGGVGAALPVAVEGVKKVVSAPFKFLGGIKDRLLKNAPDAAEFLGKNAKNVDVVARQPVDSNVAEQSVKLLKEEFPDIHRGFSNDLKEVKGEAKKNIDKLYGKFTEEAEKAKTPVDFDTPTSTDDLLKYIDEALENPLSEKFGLNPVVQKELQAARDQITKGVQLNSRSMEVVDPITKEVRNVAVPFTEGEVLKKGVQIVRAIKDRAFTRDDKGNYLKDLQGLRDMSGNLDEILYANTKGTYPQDALDAIRNANKVYRDYKQAGEALEPVMASVGKKYRPDADKFENALNKYEGQGDLDNAFNKYREIAGQAPKDNFAPHTQLLEDISGINQARDAGISQKIRFDNLKGGWVDKVAGVFPGGKYLPTSAQNKVRMLNAIDSGVAKGKAGLDSFGKKLYIEDLSVKAPILASWLKQVAEDSSRPITRAVVQSMARHAKVPEDEVESHLRELGLNIKP